jgi:hypothetical protein
MAFCRLFLWGKLYKLKRELNKGVFYKNLSRNLVLVAGVINEPESNADVFGSRSSWQSE